MLALDEPQKNSESGPDFSRIFSSLSPISFDGLVPADALPLAVHQLHGVFDPPVARAVFAHRGALGAVRTEIERRIEIRLLADPDAVLHLGNHAAAHRAVGADTAPDLGLDALFGGPYSCAARTLRTSVSGKRAGQRSTAHCQTGTAQERTPVQRLPDRVEAGALPHRHAHLILLAREFHCLISCVAPPATARLTIGAFRNSCGYGR